MQIRCSGIAAIDTAKTDCLIVAVHDKLANKTAKQLDKASKGQLKQLLANGDLKTAAGASLMLPTGLGTPAQRVLLVGAGGKGKLDERAFCQLVEAVINAVSRSNAANALWALADLQVADRDTNWQLKTIARLAEESCYQYSRTLSRKPAKPSLRTLTLDSANTAAAKRAISEGKAMAEGIALARELGNLPGNICTPSYLVSESRRIAKLSDKVKVKVLDEKQMRALKMGSLLSVTAGTRQPAKLIAIEYNGGAAKAAPQVLVGKGITFDSGGISIKPSAKMDEMKFDMCGAASVLGTTLAAIKLGLKINLVTIVAAAENLPDGAATKPGDVVTSMSGQTIEILNTDAEGRLVLCDALTWAGRYKPQAVIDVATLTGACVVALGKHASALYSNLDELGSQLLQAGNETGDRAWQMPLWEDYQTQLKSNFADIANVGGPEAGSVTAACFLARFTRDYRWAHLDIAGTAWQGGGQKGATGRPVALLTQYLIDRAG